jgi:hypothetical protein
MDSNQRSLDRAGAWKTTQKDGMFFPKRPSGAFRHSTKSEIPALQKGQIEVLTIQPVFENPWLAYEATVVIFQGQKDGMFFPKRPSGAFRHSTKSEIERAGADWNPYCKAMTLHLQGLII